MQLWIGMKLLQTMGMKRNLWMRMKLRKRMGMIMEMLLR